MYRKKLRSYKVSNDLWRQSFGRFCDDLTQVIISFLPIADKIRLECVSKQFQRLIFNKQFDLTIHPRSTEEKIFSDKLIKEFKECKSFNDYIIVDEKAFESVLKKFKFINKIWIYSAKNNGTVLQLITKYCNYLKVIKFDFRKIGKRSLAQFGQKCGQKLRFIYFLGEISSENYKKLMKFCPNVEKVYDININVLIDSEISLKKLIEIESLKGIDSKEVMEKLVDNNKKTLNKLHIDLLESKDNNNLLLQVSRLEKLEDLGFEYLTNEQTGQSFAHNLKTIAIKCTKIKRFHMTERNHGSSISANLVYQILDVIKYFSQIKIIDLSFPENNQHFREISSKLFKECKQLTRLSLSYPKFNETFFENIDLYLPQLTYLYLNFNKRYIDIDIRDEDMHSLAKLSKLRALSLDCCFDSPKFQFITDEGFCHFITNCPNIEKVRFRRGPNISRKSIETIISLAVQKPKLNFGFFFGSVEDDYPVVYMSPYKSLPNNLDLMVSNDEDGDYSFDFYE